MVDHVERGNREDEVYDAEGQVRHERSGIGNVSQLQDGRPIENMNVNSAKLLHKKADETGAERAVVAPLCEEFGQSGPEVAAVTQFGFEEVVHQEEVSASLERAVALPQDLGLHSAR